MDPDKKAIFDDFEFLAEMICFFGQAVTGAIICHSILFTICTARCGVLKLIFEFFFKKEGKLVYPKEPHKKLILFPLGTIYPWKSYFDSNSSDKIGPFNPGIKLAIIAGNAEDGFLQAERGGNNEQTLEISKR